MSRREERGGGGCLNLSTQHTRLKKSPLATAFTYLLLQYYYIIFFLSRVCMSTPSEDHNTERTSVASKGKYTANGKKTSVCNSLAFIT